MAMFTGAPTSWDAEPPHDPVAAAKSAEIDDWLKTERAKELSEKCRALVLSPDGECFDAFREKVFAYLGDEVEVSETCTAQVTTEAVRKKEKKRLAGMEPSILIYAIDPGPEKESGKLLERMRTSLMHFLFATKSIGLGRGCAVIVLIARTKAMLTAIRAGDRDRWVHMWPTLEYGKPDIKAALEAEFEAAVQTAANPLQIQFAFDEEDFKDLSVVRKLMKESHAAIMTSLGEAAKAIKPEEFHDVPDAQAPPPVIIEGPEKPQPFYIRWLTAMPVEKRQAMLALVSKMIFTLEFLLLAFAVIYALPWDTVITFAIFLLESIGLRF